MSTTDDAQRRKRERDNLFQSLHRALPDHERNVLKENARKTLQDRPPTMRKTDVSSPCLQSDVDYIDCDYVFFFQFMIYVLGVADKYQKDLVAGFRKHFAPHLAGTSENNIDLSLSRTLSL